MPHQHLYHFTVLPSKFAQQTIRLSLPTMASRLHLSNILCFALSVTQAQAQSSPVVQTVEVAGTGSLAFVPDTLTAPVGSQVRFTFYPRNHSVTSGAFGDACKPDGRIFSGYQAVGVGLGVSLPLDLARGRGESVLLGRLAMPVVALGEIECQ